MAGTCREVLHTEDTAVPDVVTLNGDVQHLGEVSTGPSSVRV